MYIARILYPVKVLGPGNRIGIWFDGCPHHCLGCSNPELLDFDEKYNTSFAVVMKLIRTIAERHPIDGFTLTGGDPFFQPEALRMLLPELNAISNDILCYTGYQEKDLDGQKDLLSQISVLIDGKYIQERNNGIILRGSDNQRVIIYRPEFKDLYDEYLKKEQNEIQTFITRESVISVGIHDNDFKESLNSIAIQKGLELKPIDGGKKNG